MDARWINEGYKEHGVWMTGIGGVDALYMDLWMDDWMDGWMIR